MFVKDPIYENLFPISMHQLNTNIQDALDFFENNYGLIISSRDACFNNLEITSNIYINSPYKKYSDTLDYLLQILPNRYNVRHRFEKNSIGFKASNQYISLKFYNKRSELKETRGLNIDSDILRIEYSLTKKKLQSIIETKGLNITDEQIKSIFLHLFRKDIILPHQKKEKELEKELIKIGKTLINKRYWIKDFAIQSSSLLSDNKFVLSNKKSLHLMKTLNENNYSKNYKTFIKLIENKHFENDKMVNEIIEKISASEANKENLIFPISSKT